MQRNRFRITFAFTNKQKIKQMKKLLIVFAFAVIATGAYAQARKAAPKSQVPAKKETVSQPAASKGYYTRQEGRIIIMNGTAAQPMTEEMVKFENGNAIMREGTYIYDNGTKKTTLEEGQRVDMKGNLISREGAVQTKVKPDVEMDAPKPEPVQAKPEEVK